MRNIQFIIILLAVGLLDACSGLKTFSGKERKELTNILHEAPLDQHYIGLAVYDIEAEKWLYRHHAERLFTPASNTKVLSLYTGLKILPDSFPLMDTLKRGKVLFIQPNGNPVFLHPEFKDLQANWSEELDLNNVQKVTIIDRPIDNKRFGPGWSWADYGYYYQAEVTSFPMYGNMLWVEWDSIRRSAFIGPDYLSDFTKISFDQHKRGIRIERDEFVNQYELTIGNALRNNTVRTAPFRFETYTITKILEDTFFRPVNYNYSFKTIGAEGFHFVPTDTVYRKMMLESDNFIAEQILLSASGQLNDTLSSQRAIEYMFEGPFEKWKNKIQWVDGSGLSRYNLFSPEFMIDVLIKVKQEIGYEGIPYFFPTGGKTGTIKNWYGADQPYVFAKTGTLSNHHALSGFIKTRSGRWLAFSFFNDNYIGSSNRIKPGMQKVLEHIRDSY